MDNVLRREELYEWASAMAVGVNQPSDLDKLLPKHKPKIDWDKLPAMLRPVRKKS